MATQPRDEDDDIDEILAEVDSLELIDSSTLDDEGDDDGA